MKTVTVICPVCGTKQEVAANIPIPRTVCGHIFHVPSTPKKWQLALTNFYFGKGKLVKKRKP